MASDRTWPAAAPRPADGPPLVVSPDGGSRFWFRGRVRDGGQRHGLGGEAIVCRAHDGRCPVGSRLAVQAAEPGLQNQAVDDNFDTVELDSQKPSGV